MKKVAFCLVENDKGEVLFVQRAYGKEKGKWSLPGGLVDPGGEQSPRCLPGNQRRNGHRCEDYP